MTTGGAADAEIVGTEEVNEITPEVFVVDGATKVDGLVEYS
jgi:hypothetical protein